MKQQRRGDTDSLWRALQPKIRRAIEGNGAAGAYGSGPPGPTGPQGPKGVTYRGEWAVQTDYEVGDIVYLDTAGSSRLTYMCLFDHTSVAATTPVPGGVASYWHEISPGYLIIDGSRTMTGALNMGHHSIVDADDADIEGTATVGEDVTLTEGVGGAIVSGVRKLHLAGDDADGEALIDGAERIQFNNEPTKSVIENPSTVEFNAAVTPGTDTTYGEGQVSWSDVEHTLVADADRSAARFPLGMTVLRWPRGGEISEDLDKFTVVYRDDASANSVVSLFIPSAWTGDLDTQRTFGLTVEDAVTEAGPIYQPVLVMRDGILRDIDTSSWSVGDHLWVAWDGTITNVWPGDAYSEVDVDTPIVSVGTVRVSNATVGVVDVHLRVFPGHTTLPGRAATDSHPATAITNEPAGIITSTDVQAAINELADDALFYASFVGG